MAAFPVFLQFVLTAMLYPAPFPPRALRVYSSSGDDEVVRFTCDGPIDNAVLSAELLTMSWETLVNEVKIFHHLSDGRRNYFVIDATTSTIATTQDNENATVFLIRTQAPELRTGGKFQLEYKDFQSGTRHQVWAVQENTNRAGPCGPHNLAVIPMRSSDGSGSDQEDDPVLDFSVLDDAARYYSLTGVLREANCV